MSEDLAKRLEKNEELMKKSSEVFKYINNDLSEEDALYLKGIHNELTAIYDQNKLIIELIGKYSDQNKLIIGLIEKYILKDKPPDK